MKTLPSLCACLLFILSTAPPAARAEDKDQTIARLEKDLADFRNIAAKKRVEMEDEIAALKKAQSAPEQPETEADRQYHERWVKACAATEEKLKDFGAHDPGSTLSMVAVGIANQWQAGKDARMNDPDTAPEIIYTEALNRIKAMQPAATTDPVSEQITTLTIQLSAAKQERARLLTYINALTGTDEYTRGWNECAAKIKGDLQSQIDAAYQRGVAAANGRPAASSKPTDRYVSTFDQYEKRKAQMDATKAGRITSTASQPPQHTTITIQRDPRDRAMDDLNAARRDFNAMETNLQLSRINSALRK